MSARSRARRSLVRTVVPSTNEAVVAANMGAPRRIGAADPASKHDCHASRRQFASVCRSMSESHAIRRIAAVACAVYALAFGSVAYQHVAYPGFSEAMEGDVLQHVERAAQGMPIYVEPSAEYIPLAYFPGYYFFAAPFHRVFGDSFAGPRLASALASFGAGAALAWIVFQESRSVSASLLAASLFFAGYRIMDESLTTALPDATLLLWLMLGWAMIVGRTSPRMELAAGVFFALALFTKQQGLLLGGAGVLYLAATCRDRNWRIAADWRAVAPTTVFGLTALVSVGIGDRVFGPEMLRFTLAVPSGWDRSPFHSMERFAFVSFLFTPFAWLLAACFVFRDGVGFGALRQPLAFAIAASSVVCLYTVSAAGSSNNHYIPLFALLEAAAVLGAWEVARKGPPGWLLPATAVTAGVGCVVAAGAAWVNEGHPLPLFVAPLLVVAVLAGWYAERRLKRPHYWAAVLLAGQFAASLYAPWDYWPPRGWQAAVADFQSELHTLRHDVAWPDYGNVPTSLTGSPIRRFPSWVVLEDVDRSRKSRGDELKPFRSRIDENPPQWLVTSMRLDEIPVWKDFLGDYELARDYSSRFAALTQLDRHWYGSRSYPRYLYRVNIGRRRSPPP